MGSGVSQADQKLLQQLVDVSGAKLVSEWTSSVTHVICGMSDAGKAK